MFDTFEHSVASLSVIANFLSPIVIVALGIIGFRQWRTELLGKSKIDNARKIGTLAFQFANEFSLAAYYPFFPEVSARRGKGSDLTEEELLRYRHERSQRLDAARRVATRLGTATWEAQELFDMDVRQLVEKLVNPMTELQQTIDKYFTQELVDVKYPNQEHTNPDLASQNLHQPTEVEVEQAKRRNLMGG